MELASSKSDEGAAGDRSVVPPSVSPADDSGVVRPCDGNADGAVASRADGNDSHAEATPLTLETVPAAMSPYMQNAEAQRICEASKVVDSGQQSALRALCSKAQREI